MQYSDTLHNLQRYTKNSSINKKKKKNLTATPIRRPSSRQLFLIHQPTIDPTRIHNSPLIFAPKVSNKTIHFPLKKP